MALSMLWVALLLSRSVLVVTSLRTSLSDEVCPAMPADGRFPINKRKNVLAKPLRDGVAMTMLQHVAGNLGLDTDELELCFFQVRGRQIDATIAASSGHTCKASIAVGYARGFARSTKYSGMSCWRQSQSSSESERQSASEYDNEGYDYA
eukprot:TRINITY_DN827_c0_g1_i1.p1 TRINITY_DN827_c0_g1~~TRINITY_DN827_c0_g1_i1.p1  ORF type:complete len:176 (-),score=17.33 TRINITY_DN827_c0_g1_i1:36-485(-)